MLAESTRMSHLLLPPLLLLRCTSQEAELPLVAATAQVAPTTNCNRSAIVHCLERGSHIAPNFASAPLDPSSRLARLASPRLSRRARARNRPYAFRSITQAQTQRAPASAIIWTNLRWRKSEPSLIDYLLSPKLLNQPEPQQPKHHSLA